MRFTVVQHAATLFGLFVFATIAGIAAAPCVTLFRAMRGKGDFLDALLLGHVILLQGILHVWLCGPSSWIFRIPLEEGRYPFRSWTAIRWGFNLAFHRMTLLFLPVFVPTFMADMYYRLSGLRAGRGVQINTAYLNDASLVTLGDGSVIGGMAFVNCHIVERGELVLAPVTIGANCTVGGGAFLNPGVVLEDGAVVASRAVVPKYTVIPHGEVWGGVPARCIRGA